MQAIISSNYMHRFGLCKHCNRSDWADIHKNRNGFISIKVWKQSLNANFTFSKAFTSWAPHDHGMSCRVKLQSGSVIIVAKLLMKREEYWAVLGAVATLKACTFSGSGDTPSSGNIYPYNTIFYFRNLHLHFCLRWDQSHSITVSVARRARSCSSWSVPYTTTSSPTFLTPVIRTEWYAGKFRRHYWFQNWDTSNGITLHV